MNAPLLALALAFGAALSPQDVYMEDGIPSTGRADPRLTAFDELMRDFLRKRGIPGVTLAISKDGRLVYSRGFGFADRDAQEVMRPDALMRIASLSKPITSAAVFLLAQEGALDLDDPLLEHIAPEFHGGKLPVDHRWADVTLRQLLQHRAGLDRRTSGDPLFRMGSIAREMKLEQPIGLHAVVRYMFSRALDFEPGTRFAYSNFGYTLLGRVIEHASGESYEDAVRSRLLKPLGIERMRIGKTFREDRAPGEVRYHSKASGLAVLGPAVGSLVREPYGTWSQRAVDSYAGWIASAPELLRFSRIYDEDSSPQLLSASSVAQTFERPASLDPQAASERTWYACGWEVRDMGAGVLHTSHVGSLPGTAALIVRRADGIGIVVLFNALGDGNGNFLAVAVERDLHEACATVTSWPEFDLFDESTER